MSEAQSIENTVIKVSVKTASVIIFAIITLVGSATWGGAYYYNAILDTQKEIIATLKESKLEVDYKLLEMNSRINYNSGDITKQDVRLTNIERKLN